MRRDRSRPSEAFLQTTELEGRWAGGVIRELRDITGWLYFIEEGQKKLASGPVDS